MKYLYQQNVPGMVKHWKLLEQMVEENYVTEENEDDYLVFGIVNYWNIERIKQEYLANVTYRKLIIYQLEPLNSNHWWPAEHIIENIRGADEIWDYDLENVEILQAHGFDPKFRPCRYTKSLKRIQTVDDPKIDLLFYGSPTESRFNHFIYLCHNKKFEYNHAWMSGIQGESLDYFLENSKIVLNWATHYTNSRQAQTRIFDLLLNDKCIISQEASINYFGDSIIQFDTYQNMMYKIETVLKHNFWRGDRTFNPSIFNPTTKIAIFIFINQKENWQSELSYIISKLQNQNLYDNVDYIQISYNGNTPFDLKFYKVNRIRYDQSTIKSAEFDLYNFGYLNPDYKLLFLSNEDLDPSLTIIDSWKETLTNLENNNIIQHTNNSFWLNAKVFNNFQYKDLANFTIDMLK